MLCSKCEDVNFQYLDELPESQQQAIRRGSFGSLYYWQGDDAKHYYYYILHENFADLARSVERACHLCSVIYEAYTNPQQPQNKRVNNVSAEMNRSEPIVLRSWNSRKREPFVESDILLRPRYKQITVSYININVELDFVVDLAGLSTLKSSIDGNIANRPLIGRYAQPTLKLGLSLSDTGTWEADSTTGSETSLKLLGLWVDDCKSNHTQCRGAKTHLPSRVIDVGFPEEVIQPRLLETTPGQDGEYIALSHCWGKPELREETQSWAADPNNLLPLNQWPKTFQQAVQISHVLMIRYLWIDTACIKQNDEDDFAREASKMAEYFAGATVVVAAYHAADSRMGCFVTRNPLLFRPCPIGFKGCKNRNFFIRVTYQSKPSRAEIEPLDSRAWCFQEVLLSRRTAGFHGNQLYWSCLRKKASEDDPIGRMVKDLHPQISPLALLRIFIHHPFCEEILVDSSEGTQDELVEWHRTMNSSYLMYQPDRSAAQDVYRKPAYQKWYDCIEYFTKRKITYVRDTLPAMSGLAKKMHDAVGTSDSYYAGLWSGDLRRGLLWAVLSPSISPTSDYVAPSWSWASRTRQKISSFFDEGFMCDPYSKTSPTWGELMATLEPQNVRVKIDLKHPDAKYGEVVAGRLHCSVRLLHGARVGKIIRGAESIYGRPHPAYHRGIGGTNQDGFFLNRQLTSPADLAAEPSKKAECTMPILSKGEITPDGWTIAQFLREKPSDLAEKDISIMLLWPFKFEGDRCIGLGLLRTNTERNEYKRVGRVEYVIPYEKLWAWTRSDAPFEDIVIV